jgi:hypothetical protein
MLSAVSDVYCKPDKWFKEGFDLNTSPLTCIKYTQNAQYITGERWTVSNPCIDANGNHKESGCSCTWHNHNENVPFRCNYLVHCVTAKHIRCNPQETYMEGNEEKTRRQCASVKVVSLLKVENRPSDSYLRETWTASKLHENSELNTMGTAKLCAGIGATA